MKTTKNLLAVVEVLATSSDSVTPTEIALQLELTRHQTQRILKDLCESGWAQSQVGGRYRIGKKIVQLSLQAAARMD